MQNLTTLLRESARVASVVLSEALRATAIVLTETGGLAQSVGRTLQDALESGALPSAAEPVARAPLSTDRQPAARGSISVEPNATPITDHLTSGPLEIPTRPPHVAPTPSSEKTLRLAERPSPAEPQTRPPAGHVSEEPVLVSESADAGAVDGAGASVHVREPWDGYRAMRAREVLERLPAVSDGVLSLVLLYEAKPGKARQTVLQAAERELARRAA
jgi:hypothetical protein